MYTLTNFNQIPFTGPAERLQNWLSPRLATKFGSKYQTLWSSLFAVLISSLQSMIQIKYNLIFYWNRIKHFQINPNRPHKLHWDCFHTTILTAFINLSFNNFVLPNFDPPPPSSGQKCPLSSGLSTDPPPPLVQGVIEWPLYSNLNFFSPEKQVMNTEGTN